MTRPQRKPESVWDYPRPPAVELDERLVKVAASGCVLAETKGAVRVLETSHPPVFYIPPEDVRMSALHANDHSTVCEYKGRAGYYDLEMGGMAISDVAWTYPDPSPGYEALRGLIAFYPGKVECLVGGERVVPQEGGFYGGWITSEIVGPFKGGAGTRGW